MPTLTKHHADARTVHPLWLRLSHVAMLSPYWSLLQSVGESTTRHPFWGSPSLMMPHLGG